MDFLCAGALKRQVEKNYYALMKQLVLHKYEALSYLFMLDEVVTEESQPNPTLFFDIKDMHEENKRLIQRLIPLLEQQERDGIPPPNVWMEVEHAYPLGYFRDLLKVYNDVNAHINVMMSVLHVLMGPELN